MASSSSHNVCLEVCIASLDDAFSAFANGANRLELNSALSLGGLTPSIALTQRICQAVPIPVIAMVRPRHGGFCYSENDHYVMLDDAHALLAAGVSGIAFGILLEDGSVDVNRCRAIIKAIGHGQAVFHRAFDVTPDPMRALEEVIDLGISRVMTSGQENMAEDGLPLIAQLVEQARGRIEVLPASGIRPHNVKRILQQTRCTQVHASLRSAARDDSLGDQSKVRFSALPGDERLIDATDGAMVYAMRQAIDEHVAAKSKQRD